jgi:hypothetical protein
MIGAWYWSISCHAIVGAGFSGVLSQILVNASVQGVLIYRESAGKRAMMLSRQCRF